MLQSTDYICENHFEPGYVTKTWKAVYKGHVLVSAPRVVALAKDAVPTRFPGCPAHLTKTEKKERHLQTIRALLPRNGAVSDWRMLPGLKHSRQQRPRVQQISTLFRCRSRSKICTLAQNTSCSCHCSLTRISQGTKRMKTRAQLGENCDD